MKAGAELPTKLLTVTASPALTVPVLVTLPTMAGSSCTKLAKPRSAPDVTANN
jgi:hypothetical protein